MALLAMIYYLQLVLIPAPYIMTLNTFLLVSSSTEELRNTNYYYTSHTNHDSHIENSTATDVASVTHCQGYISRKTTQPQPSDKNETIMTNRLQRKACIGTKFGVLALFQRLLCRLYELFGATVGLTIRYILCTLWSCT